MSTFGEWFAEKRKEAKVSQGHIAREMDYTSCQFISNWERNLSLPPKNSIKKLAKVMGISESEIIERIVKQKHEEIEAEWAK